MATKKKK
jgi:hypothetical protein